MIGYIALHRQFLDWEWYNDTNVKTLFIHCLLKANFEDKKWQGIDIKRGSFITSINVLSRETGLTTKQVRIALDKLEKTKEVGKQTTSYNTVVSILSYDKYQNEGKRGASKGQAKGKRGATTNNNISNDILNKEIIKSEIDFSPFGLDFEIHWQTWIAYKKSQFAFKYKEVSTEQTAFNELVKKAHGEKLQAIAIINNSIANGWKGLVELKGMYPQLETPNKQTITRPIGTTKSMFE